jgi:hypothetical protein
MIDDDSFDTILPRQVQEWAGVSSGSPYYDEEGEQKSLIDMNDMKVSFKRLAAIIRKHWEDL